MEMVLKPCQDRFLHPILVHSLVKKEKENIGSEMGQTKKILKKKILTAPQNGVHNRLLLAILRWSSLTVYDLICPFLAEHMNLINDFGSTQTDIE
jgi:hypothetical protein